MRRGAIANIFHQPLRFHQYNIPIMPWARGTGGQTAYSVLLHMKAKGQQSRWRGGCQLVPITWGIVTGLLQADSLFIHTSSVQSCNSINLATSQSLPENINRLSSNMRSLPSSWRNMFWILSTKAASLFFLVPSQTFLQIPGIPKWWKKISW